MRYFLIAATLLIAGPAFGQKTTFYDNYGNRTGSINREGNRDVVRDVNGNNKGYYERQGNEIIHRDVNGNRLGSSRHN